METTGGLPAGLILNLSQRLAGPPAGRFCDESIAMNASNAERSEGAPGASEATPECLEFLAEQIWSLRELVEGLRQRADSTDYKIAVEELRFATEAIERAYKDLHCFVQDQED